MYAAPYAYHFSGLSSYPGKITHHHRHGILRNVSHIVGPEILLVKWRSGISYVMGLSRPIRMIMKTWRVTGACLGRGVMRSHRGARSGADRTFIIRCAFQGM